MARCIGEYSAKKIYFFPVNKKIVKKFPYFSLSEVENCPKLNFLGKNCPDLHTTWPSWILHQSSQTGWPLTNKLSSSSVFYIHHKYFLLWTSRCIYCFYILGKEMQFTSHMQYSKYFQTTVTIHCLSLFPLCYVWTHLFSNEDWTEGNNHLIE